MPSLLDPLKIVNLELRNRIVMAPMLVEKATREGLVTEELIRYYAERANDLGLQIVEATGVSKNSRWLNLLSIDSDQNIPGLKRLTDSVHRAGTPAALQLVHLGGVADSVASDCQPVAPSNIMIPKRGKETPREMTIDEIDQTVDDFTQAARRASESGFDAVELHMAHYVLFSQFLSPLTNRRGDDYGGSLENRVRLHVRVIESIKKGLGPSYPVLCRLGVEDMIPGGLTLGDGVEAAKIIESAGADVIDVSGGLVGHLHPVDKGPGFFIPQASAVRSVVGVPVVGVGGIKTPGEGDELMRSGKVDLVAVGRAILNNPKWASEAVRFLLRYE
ncbi:MAG: NADH:flavin oxidoreductase [Candidatus Bathyarchaeota archaeon]|nr:NADH:flavin oxidoreductase [Candidatus Bathyarchaeota archaeon]